MFNQFSNKYDVIYNTTLINNNTATGSIDLNNYPNASSLTVVLIVGGVDTTIGTIKLRQSTDNSTWADITGATFNSAAYTATDDNKICIQPISLAGKQRYIQFSAVVGNGATGATITVLGIVGDNSVSPLKNNATSYGSNDVLFAGSIV